MKNNQTVTRRVKILEGSDESIPNRFSLCFLHLEYDEAIYLKEKIFGKHIQRCKKCGRNWIRKHNYCPKRQVTERRNGDIGY